MSGRVFTMRNIFILYTLGIIFTVVWILFNLGNSCKPCPTSAEDYAYPNEISKHIPKLYKASELQAWQQRLISIERQLRRKYQDRLPVTLDTSDKLDMPTIYVVTPTYARHVQKAELTRLANTFLHVPNLHWIVVEDSSEKTALVSNFLQSSGLVYTHLNKETPPSHKLQPKDPNWLKPRGVLQRNQGIQWIRDNLDRLLHKGVVYFADDDNTYDLQLFEEMRWTKRVSVWPVGLVGYLRYEAPLVEEGQVTGFFTYWMPQRPFALDMAGFAVNVDLFFENPQAEFKLQVRRGYQESELLTQLTTRQELEPKADNCTKVLVWHTRTEVPSMKNEDKFKAKGHPGSDLRIEV